MTRERTGFLDRAARAIAGRPVVAVLAAALASTAAFATPSSTDWTPMTPSIQGFGVVHVGVDNYFTVFRKAAEGAGSFPTDLGVTVGVLPFEKFQMEVGVDLVEATDHPIFGNAKLGAPEGALFGGSPALELGIFNVGTKKDVTNQNIAYLVLGMTFPKIGRFSAGPYRGNSRLLRDGQGAKENTGYMAAFDRGFLAVKGADGQEFSRLVLAADYASGNNALGAGGVGLSYYFTRSISVLTGPVWFNEEAINGRWKWTIQLDIDLPSPSKK